jgi:hypothetical protein
MTMEERAFDDLVDDVVDWLARHARVEPIDPDAKLDILAELAAEVEAILRIAAAIERERCARLAARAGHVDFARQLRQLQPEPGAPES